MAKKYLRAELQVILLPIEDIIVTSGEGELTDNPFTTDVYYEFGGRN